MRCFVLVKSQLKLHFVFVKLDVNYNFWKRESYRVFRYEQTMTTAKRLKFLSC